VAERGIGIEGAGRRGAGRCMTTWLHGCVTAWMRGCVGAWVRGCVGAWVRGSVEGALRSHEKGAPAWRGAGLVARSHGKGNAVRHLRNQGLLVCVHQGLRTRTHTGPEGAQREVN
jgi:hypothetical protein